MEVFEIKGFEMEGFVMEGFVMEGNETENDIGMLRVSRNERFI
jgi:hypothetical protein